MKKIAFIIIAILMLDFTSAYGWGAKGHDVVAAIAEQHLTPKAKRKRCRKCRGGTKLWKMNEWNLSKGCLEKKSPKQLFAGSMASADLPETNGSNAI